MENGVPVYRPVRVKSAGFTNEPNIPVRPASLANAAAAADGATSDHVETPTVATVPARLKVLAGFGEEDEVTLEQVIEALEKARPVEKANEAVLETQLTNERKAHATTIVDGLIRQGRVITRDREACIEQLCNAGDGFQEAAAQMGNARVLIKTEARSRNLAGQHAKAVEGERERTGRLQGLMDARQRDFPNEGYEERFRAVANSSEGAQLFAQMQRAGMEE